MVTENLHLRGNHKVLKSSLSESQGEGATLIGPASITYALKALAQVLDGVTILKEGTGDMRHVLGWSGLMRVSPGWDYLIWEINCSFLPNSSKVEEKGRDWPLSLSQKKIGSAEIHYIRRIGPTFGKKKKKERKKGTEDLIIKMCRNSSALRCPCKDVGPYRPPRVLESAEVELEEM